MELHLNSLNGVLKMNVLPTLSDDDIQVVVSFSRPCLVFKSEVVFQNKSMSLKILIRNPA